jgi:restriction system protein
MPGRRPRLRDGCGTLLGCLLIAAAAVFVIVRSVTVWISGHPEIVAGLIALMALGGWSGPRVAQRLGRPGVAADPAGLDPAGFEEYVAALCRRDGCRDVVVTGGAGDLGADILAVTPAGRRMLVQCKRYAPSRRVGSPEVQRVGGTYAVVHGADLAVVVTTAAYTEAAVEYARVARIRLVDGAELAEWAAEKALPPWGADRTG